MNRDEHLQWARERAFEYLDLGDLDNGYASFVSDLRKGQDDPFTIDELHVVADGIDFVIDRDAKGLRGWIEGFK